MTTALWMVGWFALVFSTLFGAMSIIAGDSIPGGILGNYVLIQITVMSLYAPSMASMQQRPYLPQHLLMSVDRRSWVRLIFRETAYDYVPGLFVSLIGLVIYSTTAAETSWPIWQVAILVLPIIACLYAAQLIVMTYPMWLSVVFFPVLVGLGVSLMFVLYLIGFSIPEIGNSLTNWPLMWFIIATLIAVVTVRFAHRRWVYWELGRI